MAIAHDDTYTLELGAWNGASVETLRFSGSGVGGFTTGGGDTPPSTNYPPRVADALMLSRTAFSARRTSGKAQPSAGELLLRNENNEGGLDYLRGYSFDGRSATMYRGKSPTTYPSGWTKTLDATMHAAEWTKDGIRLNVRDAQKYAAVLYQTTFYAGNNAVPAGLEGTPDDLKGKPKPVGFGQCFNVPAPCVNADKQIYQLHDGVIASVDEVRDGGASLGAGFPLTSRGTVTGVWNDMATDGAGTYIAVGHIGSSRAVARSTDNGVTWATATVGAATIDTLQRVLYAASLGLWIACGSNTGGTSLYSSSNGGVTWNAATDPFSAGVVAFALAWSPVLGKAIVGTTGGAYATSPNGTSSWTTHSIALAGANTWGYARAIWGKDRFVMVGYDFTNSAQIIIYSFDGLTYLASATPYAGSGVGTLKSLCYSDVLDCYITGTDGSTNPAVSIDGGVNWNLRAGNGVLGGAIYDAKTDLGLIVLAGGSADSYQISNDGITFFSFSAGVAGVQTFALAVHANTVVAAGVNIILSTVPAGGAYANATDLQDDTLAPLPGSYKVLSSSGGSYIRLGFAPTQTLTVDFTVGATSADRTYAQGWKYALGRAGLSAGSSAGNYSSADITAADAQNSAVVGRWTGPNDTGVTCGDIAGEFAETGGAWMNGDRGGVIRLKRLDDPAPNLVAHPSDLATAPWALFGGTGSVTNNFARYAGKAFSKIVATSVFSWGQFVTLPADGTYYLTFFIKSGGVAGSIGQLLVDNTSATTRINVVCTIAVDGSITAAASVGTVIRVALLPGGEGVYGVTVKGTGCIAAHANLVGASNSATISAVLFSGFLLTANDPVATITQDDMWGDPNPVASEDDNEGIPPWQTVLQWGKNYTVQTPDQLAGEVAASDRVRFGLEWRSSSASDSSVLTAHPLSQPTSKDTRFAVEADALTEAARLQALFGADRMFLEVTVEMTDTFATIELGDVVEVVYWRYGLGAGRRFAVLGVAPHAEAGLLTTITFTLWGLAS